MAKKEETKKETKEEKNVNRHEVTVRIDGTEWKEAMDAAFESKRKDVSVSGFRKGKVPRDIYEKNFGKENVVDEVTFKMHAFDTQMFEVPYGKKKNAGGGTMNFEDILEYIKDNTYDYLINIIITDAGFSIDKTQTAKFIKNIDGMIEFVTNEDSVEMKKLAKEYPTQLNYILADSKFNIK
jgi:ERCC4-type nuclease